THPGLIRLQNGALQYVAHTSQAQGILPKCTIKVPTLEDGIAAFEIPGNAKEYRIAGRGLPRPTDKRRGDIVVIKKIQNRTAQVEEVFVSVGETVKGCRMFKRLNDQKGQSFFVKIDIPAGLKNGSVVQGIVIGSKNKRTQTKINFIVRFLPIPDGFQI